MANYKTFNPIKGESEYKNELFIKIPVPSAGEVIILSGESGLIEIDSRSYGTVSTRQIRAGRYNRQIKIDVTAHEIEFSFSGTSSNNVNNFNFIVSAMCKVESAATIYGSGIRDVCALVRPALESQIKDIAASYPPSDVSVLRNILNDPYSNNSVAYDGIAISGVKVTVDIDDSYKRHLERLGKLDNEAEVKFKEVEQAKAFAQAGIDEATAIYADVMNGKMSLSDAARKLKQIDNSDFDENIRRLNTVKDVFYDLVEKGILSEEQVAQQLKLQISSVTSSSNKNQNQESLRLQQGTDETLNNNPYQVIDD